MSKLIEAVDSLMADLRRVAEKQHSVQCANRAQAEELTRQRDRAVEAARYWYLAWGTQEQGAGQRRDLVPGDGLDWLDYQDPAPVPLTEAAVPTVTGKIEYMRALFHGPYSIYLTDPDLTAEALWAKVEGDGPHHELPYPRRVATYYDHAAGVAITREFGGPVPGGPEFQEAIAAQRAARS